MNQLQIMTFLFPSSPISSLHSHLSVPPIKSIKPRRCRTWHWVWSITSFCTFPTNAHVSWSETCCCKNGCCMQSKLGIHHLTMKPVTGFQRCLTKQAQSWHSQTNSTSSTLVFLSIIMMAPDPSSFLTQNSDMTAYLSLQKCTRMSYKGCWFAGLASFANWKATDRLSLWEP